MGTRCADQVTPLYPQKLALTSPTGGGRSVGIVRSRTKATEFSLVLAVLHGLLCYENSLVVCYKCAEGTAASIYRPENGGNRLLRNVCNRQLHCDQ